MSEALPAVSIIVPTYCEAGNLPMLTERLFAAATGAGIHAELIVVDDNSPDDTLTVVKTLAERFPVRVIVRKDQRGLSSAVLRGFDEALHDTFVVMDADLQHPPEAVPELVKQLGRDGCDFVFGSRYVQGGRIEDGWSWCRRLNSGVAKTLAKPLAKLSDPMSGFFALPRSVWRQAAPLNPIGYKIALELFIKGRCAHPVEVPIAFGTRQAGESKLGISEQANYLRHLARLYGFKYPIASRLAVFLTVAIVGAGVLGVCRWLRFGW